MDTRPIKSLQYFYMYYLERERERMKENAMDSIIADAALYSGGGPLKQSQRDL